jgi:hypothetical protein
VATSLHGSKCELVNSKGTWHVETPSSVFIQKSYGDISINCKNKNSFGSKTFESSHEGIVWGNILFGGFIG